MVKFYLISNENGVAEYEYYPEGDTDKKLGVISFDITNDEFDLKIVAEGDFAVTATAKSMNKMRDDINHMRIENGENPLSEEDLPTETQDKLYYFYASHAARRIRDLFEGGTLPEKGMSMWY